MVVRERVRRDGSRLEALAIGAANAAPLVGVVALGWNAAVLVTIYWFELGVVSVWALVRALFAGRPSEFDREPLLLGALADRRVGLPIPLTGIRIRLTSLPVLVAAVPLLSVVWFVAGTVTVGLVGEAALDDDALSTVTLAALAIFAVEGVRTVVGYGYGGEYRDHSAQTAIRGVFWRACALFFAGLGTGLVAAAADDAVAGDDPITAVDPTTVGLPLLICVVLAKFGFDLAGLYRDRLVEGADALGVELGWPDDPPTCDRVDVSLSAAERRLRPPLRGRLLAGFSHAKRHPGAGFVGVFPGAFTLLFAFSGARVLAVLAAAVGIAVPLLLVHLDFWLRYAGVEYRVDGDAIVATDRLFRTPLWRVEAWDESGVRVERNRIDAWLGTSTVVIDLPDRELRLPRLPDVDPILAVFDRPATRPDAD